MGVGQLAAVESLRVEFSIACGENLNFATGCG